MDLNGVPSDSQLLWGGWMEDGRGHPRQRSRSTREFVADDDMQSRLLGILRNSTYIPGLTVLLDDEEDTRYMR